MAEQDQTISVKQRHYEIFMAIFSRERQDRRTFRFDAFLKAMGAAKFEITPVDGSVYKFTPQESEGAKSVNIHENHGTRAVHLTRCEILEIRHLLEKAYDWNTETFVIDS